MMEGKKNQDGHTVFSLSMVSHFGSLVSSVPMCTKKGLGTIIYPQLRGSLEFYRACGESSGVLGAMCNISGPLSHTYCHKAPKANLNVRRLRKC